MPQSVLLLMLLLSGAGVGGCSSAAVSGNPTAQASATASPSAGANPLTVFNACTALTDADIRSYGLDPATRDDKNIGVVGRQFGCSWENAQYSVSIYIQDVPPRAFSTNPALSNVTEISIGGRSSYQAVDKGGCDIAIPVDGKGVVVGLSLKFSTRSAGGFDSCGVDKGIANNLVTKLPK